MERFVVVTPINGLMPKTVRRIQLDSLFFFYFEFNSHDYLAVVNFLSSVAF